MCSRCDEIQDEIDSWKEYINDRKNDINRWQNNSSLSIRIPTIKSQIAGTEETIGKLKKERVNLKIQHIMN